MLSGRHVILDELSLAHVDGLVAAAAEDPSLYQWNGTPQGEPAMRARYSIVASEWPRLRETLAARAAR